MRSRSTHSESWEDDTLHFNIARQTGLNVDLGIGEDTVNVSAPWTVPQVRVTFTSAEVGNGLARDAGTMANQDGGLAVRLQAENGSGALTGAISRLDDEGITFESNGRFTFDVRDLVSGVERGAYFDTVRLGTSGHDFINESRSPESYYINAGMGNDRVIGGKADDFLVGGAGNDTLYGQNGDDTFIGGAGNDTISGGYGDDVAIVNLATDGADQVNLNAGLDTVKVTAPLGQVRVTFTSGEVGNGSAYDSNTMLRQDGGLAVRLQTEDAAGNLVGMVSRYDDEGISFVSAAPGVTFDVRDLVSGVQRGDQFEVVTLGTRGNDRVDESGEAEAYYINAGIGNDRVTGGLASDFLVGGLGNDRLNGSAGNDMLLGGAGKDRFIFAGHAGNDRILDFVSGTDRIDLSAYDIDISAVQRTTVGAHTVVGVDTNADGAFDFRITLLNSGAPQDNDFVF